MRDSNLEFRIVDLWPSNFGYAAIISLESGLLFFVLTALRYAVPAARIFRYSSTY